MFCSKCGKEIPDNVKFCAYCGAPVQSGSVLNTTGEPDKAPAASAHPKEIDDDKTVVVTESSSAQPPKGEDELKVDELSQGAPSPGHSSAGADASKEEEQRDDGAASTAMPVIPLVSSNGSQQGAAGGANAGAQNGYAAGQHSVPVNPKPGEAKPKKSGKGIIFGVLIVLIVAVAALLVFLVRAIWGGSDVSKRLVYLKDDELSAVLDITAKEPVDVEIERLRNDDDMNTALWGRYSEDGKYFYYFSKIDTGDNCGTLCRLEVDKLKKDESANDSCIQEIDSKVSLGSFALIDNDSIVYRRKGDELWLYRGGETTELADTVNSYELTDDKKYIVYLERDEEEEDGDLYWMEISEKAKAEEVDDHVTGLHAVEGSDFIVYAKSGKNASDYYVAGIDRSASLVAEDVSEIGTVAENSFYYTVLESKELPLYDYVIDSFLESDNKATEPDVRDYMKTVSAKNAISSNDLEYYDSMEDFLDGRAYYDEASGLYSYNNYEKYETYYYDGETDTWYGDYNQEDYYEATEAYSDIARRDELREALKQETVDQSYGILYHYQNGESTAVCENVASISSWGKQRAVYTKIDLESPVKEYKIDEIGSADSLRNQILYSDTEAEEDVYYCHISGSGEEELSDFDSVADTYLSEDGKTLVIEGNPDEGVYELVQYTVGSDGLGDGKKITDEGVGEGFHDNLFYYCDNISDDEKDLYCFDNGKEKIIAKDVSEQVFLADDGTVAGIIDWDSDHTSGDLNVFDQDGRGEDLVRDVEGFRYLGSGTYLFVEGGDLYYLNKKGEETRLARNVSYFWYPGELPGRWI